MDVRRASSDSAIHSSVTGSSAAHLSGTGSMLLSNGPSALFFASMMEFYSLFYLLFVFTSLTLLFG